LFERDTITQFAATCACCFLVCLPGIHLSSGFALGMPEDSCSVKARETFLPDSSRHPDSVASTDSSAEIPVVRERSIVIPAVVEPVLDSLLVADSAALRDTLVEPVPEIEPGFNSKALRFNGLYLNAYTVGDSTRIEKLFERCRNTPISGFVIDMKDDQGYLAYRSNYPLAAKIGANTGRVKNPAALVQRIHDQGMIASARVVAFKDPRLSSYCENGAYPYAVLDSATGFPWRQDNGETWANPQDDRVHDYLVAVVQELVSFGFDQIQLDYIRFPSDGDVGTCFYSVAIDSLNKAEVISLLLSRVREVIDTTRISLAADVFGWVPWLHKDRDYWIGQDYDLIAEYADVICPMLYSSHFPETFKTEYGPLRAYHIVREGTIKAVMRKGPRRTGVQPYIQGFNWQAPYFGPDYILQQMQAATEGGAVGWIVWNAKNDYSTLWDALHAQALSSQAETGER